VEMARELVDFLEEQWPLLLASGVQLVVALVVLFGFGRPFGVGGVLAVAAVLGLYALFQPRFYRLNRALNGLAEAQVAVLQAAGGGAISRFFRQRRAREVALSDLDSVLYGAIYAVMFAFLLANLWLASLPADPSTAAAELVTAGSIFVVLSYSWALVESAAQLPATAQHWTRLMEIQERLGKS
ncbi:MAG: ABC transporter six-transmembrane domain-containing protein, partial [Pseudomonadota bacterium]